MSQVTITVSGETGSGKSAIAGEIEIYFKAAGLEVEWKNADREHWTHGNEYWIDLYKPSLAIVEQNTPWASRCCMNAPDPGPWTPSVDDSADAPMIDRMHSIRDRLSYNMPMDDFISALKAAVNIDSRTTLGGDLHRCLLWNAVHRLEILAKQIDPDAIWRQRGLPRLKDAWAVFRGRAVVTYVKAEV